MFKSIVCMNGLLTSLHCRHLGEHSCSYACLILHMPFRLSIFLFVICSFISPSFYLSICLPVHLYVGLTVHLHNHLSFFAKILIQIEPARLNHVQVNCMYEWFVDKHRLSVTKENISDNNGQC